MDDALPEAITKTNQVVSSGMEKLSLEEKVQMKSEMTEIAKEAVVEMDEKILEPTNSSPSLVTGTAGHPASGQVRVIATDDETILRFEEFETINGPKLHLYLSKDLEGSDFIDLGPISGTKGNINYSIPNDVDLSEYKYVMHWCVPFGVLFNYAEIN